jgi:hypothetical protein
MAPAFRNFSPFDAFGPIVQRSKAELDKGEGLDGGKSLGPGTGQVSEVTDRKGDDEHPEGSLENVKTLCSSPRPLNQSGRFPNVLRSSLATAVKGSHAIYVTPSPWMTMTSPLETWQSRRRMVCRSRYLRSERGREISTSFQMLLTGLSSDAHFLRGGTAERRKSEVLRRRKHRCLADAS